LALALAFPIPVPVAPCPNVSSSVSFRQFTPLTHSGE